jgi:hypothetical protein
MVVPGIFDSLLELSNRIAVILQTAFSPSGVTLRLVSFVINEPPAGMFMPFVLGHSSRQIVTEANVNVRAV